MQRAACVRRRIFLLCINKRRFLKNSAACRVRRDICGVRYDREHWWAKTSAAAAAATDTRTRCGGGAPKILRRRGIERGGRTPRARTHTVSNDLRRVWWERRRLGRAAAASVERYTMYWRRTTGCRRDGRGVLCAPYYRGKTTPPPPRSSAVACPRRRRRRLVGRRRRLLHRQLCRSGSVCARSLFPAPPPSPLEPRPCVYITRVCTGCPMTFVIDDSPTSVTVLFVTAYTSRRWKCFVAKRTVADKNQPSGTFSVNSKAFSRSVFDDNSRTFAGYRHSSRSI